MRTELIPAADVRIGDCLLDEQGAPAVVTSTRWQGVGGGVVSIALSIIPTAGSPVVETWWPVPSSSGKARSSPGAEATQGASVTGGSPHLLRSGQRATAAD